MFTSGITGPVSLAIAAICFVALLSRRTPAWSVVAFGALAGALLL